MSAKPYADCDRCGCRYTKRTDRPHTLRGLCPSCLEVEPDWPNGVHVPEARAPRPVPRWTPREADAVVAALWQILARLDAHTRKRTRVCACGCLLAAWEATCPACTVAARSEALGGAA